MTLKLFVLFQSCYMPSYIIVGSIVFELHDMRIICLLKAACVGYKYDSVLNGNQLHSLFQFV